MMLGASTIYAYPKSVIGAIQTIAEMGFRHVNIFAYPPHFKEDGEEFVSKVKDALFKYGLDASIKIQAYTINPAATNPHLREKSIEEIKYWIDVASRLECSQIIIRSGMFFYAERVFFHESYERLLETLAGIMDFADERGLEVLIENYPYPFDVVRDPADFLKIQKNLGRDLGLALNVPHLYDVYKRRKKFEFSQEFSSILPFTRMIYVSEYMNPWDYPHKLNVEYDNLLKLTSNVVNFFRRGNVRALVFIAFNSDELKELKTKFSDML